MKKEGLEIYSVLFGSDIDLKIHYPGSSKKGKRYYLVTKIDLNKKVFEVIYFSKKTPENINKNNYVALEEMPDSVLRVDNHPRQISFSSLAWLTPETVLTDKSVNIFKKKAIDLKNYAFL